MCKLEIPGEPSKLAVYLEMSNACLAFISHLALLYGVLLLRGKGVTRSLFQRRDAIPSQRCIMTKIHGFLRSRSPFLHVRHEKSVLLIYRPWHDVLEDVLQRFSRSRELLGARQQFRNSTSLAGGCKPCRPQTRRHFRRTFLRFAARKASGMSLVHPFGGPFCQSFLLMCYSAGKS